MTRETKQPVLKNQQQVNEAFTLDLKRAAMMAAIARVHVSMVLDYPQLPKGLNTEVLKQTYWHLDKFDKEVMRMSNEKRIVNLYADRILKQDKLINISNIIDSMARIGFEQDTEVYDEFLGLITDLIDAVYYSQRHRKKMHFGKYKALFKLIAEEIKHDVNGEPGRVLYEGKGELFFRGGSPITHTEIKK